MLLSSNLASTRKMRAKGRREKRARRELESRKSLGNQPILSVIGLKQTVSGL